MYCKICGAALAPGDVFCKNCGASNTPTNPQPVNLQPPVQPQSAVAPSAEPTPVQGFSQPMPESIPQPMVNEVPFTEPAQPVFNQTPMYGNVQPQPSFTQPVQPQPMNNSPEKKDNGKLLMIIGIVVGVLAVAVIAYLIYSTLSAKDNDGNNNGGGTTVVTQNTYGVTFAGHRFTIDSDIVAVVNANQLEITAGSWKGIMKAYPVNTGNRYSLLTEAVLINGFPGLTIESLSQKTYSGLNYWKVDIYASSDGSRATHLFMQRADGGYWYALMATPSFTKVPDAYANELLDIVKTAKQSTTSNIEENREAMNIPELSFTEEQATEPTE